MDVTKVASELLAKAEELREEANRLGVLANDLVKVSNHFEKDHTQEPQKGTIVLRDRSLSLKQLHAMRENAKKARAALRAKTQVQRALTGRKSGPVRCTVCRRVFGSRSLMMKHKFRVHKTLMAAQMKKAYNRRAAQLEDGRF